jgi:hypothetical protein
MKRLTVAGSASPVGPLPEFAYVRWYVPPVTGRLVQQLSVPAAPQLVSPSPLVAQLGGGGVAVHVPLTQKGTVPSHATGSATHWPFDPHV